MGKWISKTLLSALAVFFISSILPGVSIEESYLYAIIVAVVIGLLNSFVKPILVVFTLPATILTLGLFMLVINAGIILIADYTLDGFAVDGFWWALLFSALLSMVNSFLHNTFLPEKKVANQGSFSSRRQINNEQTTTTVTGKKVTVENGKKTIIIEKD